jgi:hypothetical protein
LTALREDFARPASVRGPVLFKEFARLAASWAGERGEKPASGGGAGDSFSGAAATVAADEGWAAGFV